MGTQDQFAYLNFPQVLTDTELLPININIFITEILQRFIHVMLNQ